MNATGSLRLKRGIWQMVFDYEDEAGQRRQKSESTGLPEKGNKRRAEAMLRERLAEYERQTQVELELHTAVASGHGCGAQRPLCGLTATPI